VAEPDPSRLDRSGGLGQGGQPLGQFHLRASRSRARASGAAPECLERTVTRSCPAAVLLVGCQDTGSVDPDERGEPVEGLDHPGAFLERPAGCKSGGCALDQRRHRSDDGARHDHGTAGTGRRSVTGNGRCAVVHATHLPIEHL